MAEFWNENAENGENTPKQPDPLKAAEEGAQQAEESQAAESAAAEGQQETWQANAAEGSGNSEENRYQWNSDGQYRYSAGAQNQNAGFRQSQQQTGYGQPNFQYQPGQAAGNGPERKKKKKDKKAGKKTGRRVAAAVLIAALVLVIVGGGYIGLEFASMYASFGSKVTVLEGFAELIPREDRDIAAAVREALEKKGIEFRIGARVESVSDTAGGVRVAVADTQTGGKYEIDGDAVLLATGRRPATAGLNLEAAGIETDDRGAVRVDAHLRTTAPRVFAAGDVTGGLQFTYVSLDDFRIIRDVLLGDGARTTANRGPVPYSVFIEPTLSHVGMHEEEARKAGRDIRVNRIAVAAFPRSRILGSTEGVLKAVIDAKTDEILGCTLFGAESGEVINTVATAMKHGVTAHDLSNSIYTHPSMSESLNDLFA